MCLGELKLNIGVIAPELPPAYGGMQEHAVGLIKHLSKQHKLTVFTLKGRFVSAPNVDVIDTLTEVLSKDVAALQQQQLPDIWLALSAGAACYAPYLRRPFFSYIHGNDFLKPWAPFPSAWVVKTSRRVNGFPLLGRFFSSTLASWRRRKMGQGLRQSDLVFANSRFTRQRCCEIFSVDTARVAVVAPGIDDAHFESQMRAGDQRVAGPLRVLTVSRLTKATRRKNVASVIEAIALLEAELDVQYLIVGQGNDLARHRKLAEKLGLDGRVTFAGAVENQKLQELYACADVFVLAVQPSMTDVEGFGMVYVEAAAHGVPVIAVDSGGVADAVRPEMGLLIKTADPSEIAKAIKALHSKRLKFDQNSVRAAARSYSAENTSKELLRWIEQVVGGVGVTG